jgi:hypothetical protein
MSATSTVTYNSTHTVTYVTDKMLLLLKEIIREIGLDPAKLVDEWGGLEKAVSTWLRSQHLKKVTLEIFDSKTDALVCPWDLEVIYGYGGDGSFWADTTSIRYNIAKAGVLPSQCNYRFLIHNSPGRPDVDGWGPVKARSLEGFRRYNLGATIGGNGIGTEVAYWRKT